MGFAHATAEKCTQKSLEVKSFHKRDDKDLAELWSKFLNPEAMSKQRVFNWLSRCVFTTREDDNASIKSGAVFLGDSWHAMPNFGGERGQPRTSRRHWVLPGNG
ncbi:hypothetical protein F4819DRAFT_491658 [Hypoxylon fuscum]|nr:hypothetical protein F4819DRAFT_491658 [Hypoxylon fuscum]